MKIMIVLLAFILFISMASALQFQTIKDYEGNKTTRIHMVANYDPLSEDFIKGGNPLSVYILYNALIDTWNNENLNYKVNYCTFTVKKFPHLSNNSVTLTDTNLTGDTVNSKFFVSLEKTDFLTADMRCVFAGNRTIETPADMTLVSPTFECKACQEFEAVQTEIASVKARSINSFNVDNINTIKNIVGLNFEFLIIMFWILVIVLLLGGIGMIFLGAYWLYMLVARMLKLK